MQGAGWARKRAIKAAFIWMLPTLRAASAAFLKRHCPSKVVAWLREHPILPSQGQEAVSFGWLLAQWTAGVIWARTAEVLSSSRQLCPVKLPTALQPIHSFSCLASCLVSSR